MSERSERPIELSERSERPIEVSELATRWVEALNTHDVDAIVAWYAEDGMHRMASGNTYTGAAEIRAMVTRSFDAYPDVRFELRGAFAAGRDYTIEYTMLALTAAVDGVLVGRTNGEGRVVTCVDYLDHLDLRRQLGLTSNS